MDLFLLFSLAPGEKNTYQKSLTFYNTREISKSAIVFGVMYESVAALRETLSEMHSCEALYPCDKAGKGGVVTCTQKLGGRGYGILGDDVTCVGGF